MKKGWTLAIVIVLNFIIAFGFFIEHRDSGYSSLASDVHSIIPIGQKFDNPNLFQNDLFLNTLDNVKYYTPFFVQPMRFFAKTMDYNYLQGLNLFSLFAHLVFGLLWYLLIYKYTKNFWVALLVSLLIRGVVWLPGNEIWGISDLWTMMPRTVYSAFMPLPFLLLSKSNRIRFLLASFLIGLIFNFHPITGLGGIICFGIFILLYYYYYKSEVTISFKTAPLAIAAMVLGMLPFILTYFTKTDVTINYDVALYKEAFSSRIPGYFENPIVYLKQWLKLKTLFFILPLIAYFVMSYKLKNDLKIAKILIGITFSILFLSSISVVLEQAVNSLFDLNIRMAFQFIRLQKLAILPAYFAIAFLLLKLSNYKNILQTIVFVFVLSLALNKATVFNKVPLLGDDITRSILPNTLSIVKNDQTFYNEVDDMMHYVYKHTDPNAIFYGPPIIRCSTKRSVVLDYKGASALIEGNPAQFIQWYQDNEAIKNLGYPERIKHLKPKGIDYIITTRDLKEEVTLIHSTKSLNLFKIN